MKSKKEIERTLKENKGTDFVLPMTWDVMFEQMFISKEAMPLLECIISIIRELDEKVNDYKHQNDLYDFVDISKLAIKIVKENKIYIYLFKEGF